jgi:hypothetical protein
MLCYTTDALSFSFPLFTDKTNKHLEKHLGAGGEMAQTTYTHMNKGIKKKEKHLVMLATKVFEYIIFTL